MKNPSLSQYKMEEASNWSQNRDTALIGNPLEVVKKSTEFLILTETCVDVCAAKKNQNR
jgi:hypothetical protein